MLSASNGSTSDEPRPTRGRSSTLRPYRWLGLPAGRYDRTPKGLVTMAHRRDPASDAIAAGLGSGLGTLLGGPAGAAAGAAGASLLVEALCSAGSDQLSRLLSEGERGRIEITLKLAGAEVRRRWEVGQRPRQDLFDRAYDNAVELFEGTLTKARNVYEAAKLKHLAHFMVDALFDPEADLHATFHLLNLAERLTYQQYVMLALFDRRHHDRQLGLTDFGHQPGKDTRPLMLPLADLFETGLIQEETEQLRAVGGLASRSDGSGIGYSCPERILLSLGGETLADRLALQSIPDGPREELARRLTNTS